MKKGTIILIGVIVIAISVIILVKLLSNTAETSKDKNKLAEFIEQQKKQTIEVLRNKPKYEILKKIYFDTDSLIYERITINEKGDTLEKEDIPTRTVYTYDIHENLIKEDFYINKDEGTRVGTPKPEILYSIISTYDNKNRLIKSTFDDQIEKKQLPYYDAKYENNKLVESIKHGVQNSFKTSYFYNENGILIKTISQWLNFGYTPVQKLYEYLDDKLFKESVYYFDTDLQQYVLKGIYKYSYKEKLLIQKSYLDYDSWTGKVEEDSSFQFKYDISGNLFEEKVTAVLNKFSIYKKRYAVVKLIKYKYDKNNRLIESIKFGTSKNGEVDKRKIDKKMSYEYDNQNRIIRENEEGEFFGKATYKYFYKPLN